MKFSWAWALGLKSARLRCILSLHVFLVSGNRMPEALVEVDFENVGVGTVTAVADAGLPFYPDACVLTKQT